MPYATLGALCAFQFESLRLPGVEHAIFTRRGGVSEPPWRSLNVGGSVGDDPKNVATNRRRMFESAGRPNDTLAYVWQIHSERVLRIDRPSDGVEAEKADAMVTDHPDITLMMRFADCVPILAYDPSRPAVGVAHAGWKGTLHGIAQRLVETMEQDFGTDPGGLVVGIGPSIAAHHYPVGPEVADAFRRSFGTAASQFLDLANGELHLDLWGANRWQLEQMGVAHIEISGICTACRTEDWFSHRAESGKTGRFGALLNLAARAP